MDVTKINRIKIREFVDPSGEVNIIEYLEFETFTSTITYDPDKIICVVIKLFEEQWMDDEMVSSGSRSNSFSLMVDLKDMEKIYSLCGDIFCGLHTAFNKLFVKENKNAIKKR